MQINIYRIAPQVALLVLIALPGIARAQDVQSSAGERAGESETKQTASPRMATAPNSFVERTLKNTDKHLGFALGVSQSYMPGFNPTTSERQSATLTTFSPRTFFGRTGKRAEIQVDYVLGFRKYNLNNIPVNTTHRGMANYRYVLSPHLNLALSSELYSGFNDDQALSSGSSLTVLSDNTYEQLLYVRRKRTTTERLQGNLGYNVTKRTNIDFFGFYDYLIYHDSTLSHTYALVAGVRASHQFNRWFYLDNTYSHTLSGQKSTGETIVQRLQVGGLRFQSRQKLELSLGGGIEAATYQRKTEMTGSALVTLTKATAATALSLTYHRGFNLAAGTGTVLIGDNVGGSLTRWIGKRINLQLTSNYTRGNRTYNQRLQMIWGNGVLEAALGNHLLLSGQYNYISQQTRNLLNATPNASRSSGSIGLEYYFSSLKQRSGPGQR